MPETMSFTDDGHFPNSGELEGYTTLEVFEPVTNIWSRLSMPKHLILQRGGRDVGELSLGRDGTGLFRYDRASYGVSSRSVCSADDRNESYFLEAFDLEFEKSLGRGMSHGEVSVVSLPGIEVQQSLIGREQSQRALLRKWASVAKAPGLHDGDEERNLMCRVFVRNGADEIDLLVLNVLMLTDRATWHAIVART